MDTAPPKSILGAIGIAAGVCLAINVVRYHGEREHWAPSIFNTEAGGGGSPLGITWLVLIFGFWFGRRLAQNGHRPAATGKALLIHLGGMLAVAGAFALAINFVEAGRTRVTVIGRLVSARS